MREFVPSESSTGREDFARCFYPSLKLGSGWFAYSAVQVDSTPYFYYDAYYPPREVETYLLQGFVGYSHASESRAISVKVGKLSSAFGSFPLRYDDTQNPLIDSPLNYSDCVPGSAPTSFPAA